MYPFSTPLIRPRDPRKPVELPTSINVEVDNLLEKIDRINIPTNPAVVQSSYYE